MNLNPRTNRRRAPVELLGATNPYGSEGPARELRVATDLVAAALSAQERAARAAALALLATWLASHEIPSVRALLANSELFVNAALESYGQSLFDTGGSKTRYKMTLLAVQDLPVVPRLRRAWKVLTAWEALEPGCSHLPLPFKFMAAMASLAMLWGWWDFALALMLGFDGMLRVTEILDATRSCLVLPSDGIAGAFFIVKRPKTARTSGRSQHVRIRRPDLIRALEHRFGDLAPATRLWPYERPGFKRRWEAVCGRLGIPAKEFVGFSPASLRPGGASHLYTECDRLDTVLWRGRWENEKTLRHYIQELPCMLAEALAVPAKRELIARLRWATGDLLEYVPKRVDNALAL